MTPWVVDWLRAFALTLAIECVLAVPLLGRLLPRPAARPLARRVAAVILVNLVTHPLVWFLFPGLSLPYPLRVGLSELWAFSAEGGAYLTIFPDLGWRRAIVVALVANAASFGVGLLL